MPSGSWDKTFGRAGFLRASFGSGITGRIHKTTVQPDGNILLCGGVFNPDIDTWMMRFRPNGRVDTSFGNSGVVIDDFQPGGTDAPTSMALSPDGKIRIAGYHGTPLSFLVAKYSATGTLEQSTSFAFTPGQSSYANDLSRSSRRAGTVLELTRNPNTTINGNVSRSLDLRNKPTPIQLLRAVSSQCFLVCTRWLFELRGSTEHAEDTETGGPTPQMSHHAEDTKLECLAKFDSICWAPQVNPHFLCLRQLQTRRR